MILSAIIGASKRFLQRLCIVDPFASRQSESKCGLRSASVRRVPGACCAWPLALISLSSKITKPIITPSIHHGVATFSTSPPCASTNVSVFFGTCVGNLTAFNPFGFTAPVVGRYFGSVKAIRGWRESNSPYSTASKQYHSAAPQRLTNTSLARHRP